MTTLDKLLEQKDDPMRKIFAAADAENRHDAGGGDKTGNSAPNASAKIRFKHIER